MKHSNCLGRTVWFVLKEKDFLPFGLGNGLFLL